MDSDIDWVPPNHDPMRKQMKPLTAAEKSQHHKFIKVLRELTHNFDRTFKEIKEIAGL